jgi:hypothetical protein
VELRLSAKVHDTGSPIKEIGSKDLLAELGNPSTLPQLRTALRDRYGDTVVAEAFKKLRIRTFEEFRKRGARFLKIIAEQAPPYDPNDPANVRTYPLCICIRLEPLLRLSETMRTAKFCRNLLENERDHREIFDGVQIKRPYVFLVLFPESTATDNVIPGLSAAELKTQTQSLFDTEEMVAWFIANS